MNDPFKELRRIAGQAIATYHMIESGDRILVGLSGGKDSFALLHTLHALRSRAPVNFEIIAATFDPGFSEFNLPGIVEYCHQMGWKHCSVSMPVAQILEEKKLEASPCVLCSRLRRGKLYGLMREQSCNKLALGQHFDDIATSFLMSLCRGQGLTTMGPNVPARAENGVRIIRPLALVPESLILECVASWDLPSAGQCHYKDVLKNGDRAFFRKLMDELAIRIPHLRSQMARSLANLHPEHLLDPAWLKKS